MDVDGETVVAWLRTWGAEAVLGGLAVVGLVLTPVVLLFDLITRRLGVLVGGSAAIEEPYTD